MLSRGCWFLWEEAEGNTVSGNKTKQIDPFFGWWVTETAIEEWLTNPGLVSVKAEAERTSFFVPIETDLSPREARYFILVW